MSDALDATSPTRSASVAASAGTGKTWLLVTRIVRLLLAGAAPGGILAVTFTNRAAGEMRERLRERCASFALADDARLDDALSAMGVAPDAAMRDRARALYDELLTTPWPPRVVTFHALCQDLLARFPLEAGVAPGAELLAHERELHDAAWAALLADCAQPGEPADTLAWLAAEAGSLDAARGWLRAFVAQRVDWWAWTDGADDAAAFALERLRALTGFDGAGPGEVFDAARRAQVLRLCELVGLAPRAEVAAALDATTALVADRDADPGALADALRALLQTQQGAQRKALAKKPAQDLHGDEIARLQRELLGALADARVAALNRRWIVAGSALLAHYQRLKAEARVLDFSDLEWLACRLLTDGDNAQWIQYRLDRRIDHLLVDEFQDTNPTQWRMLRPLLDEIAAGDAGRARSAFIVGDDKQSIYGFRRADPRLLHAAASLLTERLGATPTELAGSRRSAPAVVEFVNQVFGLDHSTHRAELDGRVEWLAVTPDDADAHADAPDAAGDLRDPLARPRATARDELRGIEEARAIAARIERFAADGVGWGDMMILVRRRTRLAAIETALRERGIPYASDSKGLLLERPEIGDLMALLEFLSAPWHDLRLARVLKSPLFACDDADLMRLASDRPDAGGRRGWFERLLDLEAGGGATPALARAARLLRAWRGQADAVPVHDLLDQVFADANVLARYHAASPPHLRAAVRANLLQFLELALDADAGRYPTLHRLVERLERTREAAAGEREYDDAPVAASGGRVRVMTVHAAKGLEARVVFVAQTDLDAVAGGGHRAWVDWPPDQPRPTMIVLGRERDDAPSLEALCARRREAETTEDRNLLYVALTRARQYLVVSGMPGEKGWYPQLERVFAERGFAPFVNGEPVRAQTAAEEPPPPVYDAWSRPLQQTDEPKPPPLPADPGALEYGALVHVALEHVVHGADAARAAVVRAAGSAATDPVVARAIAAAARVAADASHGWLFDPARYTAAWNEARLSAADGGYGVVDRLVVTDDEVWIVDYKTDRDALVTDEHRAQLSRYADLARALWPGRAIRAALLFTAALSFQRVI